MSDGTKIEWTDASWNVINGCTVVSPGCTNCYAMRLAGTRLKHIDSRKGLTQDSKAGPVWTGEVRLHEPALTDPLRWKRPRRIFVCAHGDLFHEAVPDEWIDRVFAVMALAPQHTFQVLTKRPKRMREYMRDADRLGRVFAASKPMPHPKSAFEKRDEWPYLRQRWTWPLSNVWLGVSVEDQTRAEERIPLLLDTPAAVRWVSAEPLLGPVNMAMLCVGGNEAHLNPFEARYFKRNTLGGWDLGEATLGRLNWIVVGGESGHGARWMKNEWARLIVLQCRDAGVSVFVKQLSGMSGLSGRAIHDIEQFPADLRVREYPK